MDRLETQSILINAERRIDKTQILRQMVAGPRNGWKPIFRDLEQIHTAPEFAERVAKIPEFEIPLRLFRYGIRYLISHKESEFVELIKPERRILRQALGLEPEE